MSELTIDVIRGRVASVCCSAPFGFTPAKTPFSFELQPNSEIDEVFRLETEFGSVLGGFNFTEERTDQMHIWVARKQAGDPEAMYQRLLCDVSSLRAAVIRDGAVTSGDYHVPDDGAGFEIAHDKGREFAVLQLTLPVNYEALV